MMKRAFSRNSPSLLQPVEMSAEFGVRLGGRKSLLVGRNECCDVVVPLAMVSKHHCRIYRAGRHWYVEDLDSRNGTYVNQQRVVRKRLRVGDVLSVADFHFLVK